ncbi:MAG: hypothetical protein OXI15_05080, partial [Chromatiales bacterium]|nr:hypothetical protein [Chromatiales bacterium]
MKLSMRLRRSTVLGGTVSLLLAGAGAGALYLTPLDLDSQFHAAIGLVQTIHRTASRWAVETSRVRADPTADFDSLSAFVPEVRDMRSAFSETTGSLPLGQQVAADAQAYVDALDALAERVERFKTAYSAIRNSERYLPLASDALVEQALDAGDEQFAQELRSVAGSLAGYVAAPSDADAQRLLVRIQMLSERGPPEPPEGPDALNESLQSYVAHARVVLAERSRLKVHLDAIASSELGRRTEPLVTALEMERIAHRSRVSLWRYGALAAGAGVLVVWVLVGLMRSRPPPGRGPPPPPPPPPPAPGGGGGG